MAAAAGVGARRRERFEPAPERRGLHAVIDFGCAAVGDPACDLVMAWTFFPGPAAAVFRRGLHFGEATWARARGWALWKALVTLSGAKHGGDGGQAAARRFGWRYGPRQIIGRVIADHARPIRQ